MLVTCEQQIGYDDLSTSKLSLAPRYLLITSEMLGLDPVIHCNISHLAALLLRPGCRTGVYRTSMYGVPAGYIPTSREHSQIYNIQYVHTYGIDQDTQWHFLLVTVKVRRH